MGASLGEPAQRTLGRIKIGVSQNDRNDRGPLILSDFEGRDNFLLKGGGPIPIPSSSKGCVVAGTRIMHLLGIQAEMKIWVRRRDFGENLGALAASHDRRW